MLRKPMIPMTADAMVFLLLEMCALRKELLMVLHLHFIFRSEFRTACHGVMQLSGIVYGPLGSNQSNLLAVSV